MSQAIRMTMSIASTRPYRQHRTNRRPCPSLTDGPAAPPSWPDPSSPSPPSAPPLLPSPAPFRKPTTTCYVAKPARKSNPKPRFPAPARPPPTPSLAHVSSPSAADPAHTPVVIYSWCGGGVGCGSGQQRRVQSQIQLDGQSIAPSTLFRSGSPVSAVLRKSHLVAYWPSTRSRSAPTIPYSS